MPTVENRERNACAFRAQLILSRAPNKGAALPTARFVLPASMTITKTPKANDSSMEFLSPLILGGAKLTS